MNRFGFLKPILIHIIISFFSIFIFTIIDNIIKDNVTARKAIYTLETILIIIFYLIMSRIFIKTPLSKNQTYAIYIITVINLFLGLCGYLIMNFTTGVNAENGTFIMMIFQNFNGGFYPFALLMKLPELLEILLLSLMPSVCIYLGSTKLFKYTI